MQTHKGSKPFSCHHCDYTCALKQHLTRHMLTHTGERPFSCNHCDYTCSRAQQLTIHMCTHTGIKPFSCDVCGRSFAQGSNLKDHQLTHTGEKPYKCEHCGTLFSQKRSLTKHVRGRCKVLKKWFWFTCVRRKRTFSTKFRRTWKSFCQEMPWTLTPTFTHMGLLCVVTTTKNWNQQTINVPEQHYYPAHHICFI